MGMVMVKEKKHPNPVTPKVVGKSKEDPLLQMIGLVEAKKSDVTKDHNKVLYRHLRGETIKRIDGARKRMEKSYVPPEKVTREFLR